MAGMTGGARQSATRAVTRSGRRAAETRKSEQGTTAMPGSPIPSRAAAATPGRPSAFCTNHPALGCGVRVLQRIPALWLAALLLLAPALVAASEPPSAAAAGAAQPTVAEQAWAAIEPEALARDSQPLRRAPDKREARSERETRPGQAGSWLRTWGALAGVVALILLLAWGYRVVTSGGLPLARARHPGLIEVVSRAGLSPRHALFLVRVGPRLVLCGVSQERISLLDSIDDPELTARLAGQAASAREDSALAAFRRCLEIEERGGRRDECSPARHPDPAGGGLTGTGGVRLSAARRSLSGAMERIRAVADAG